MTYDFVNVVKPGILNDYEKTVTTDLGDSLNVFRIT